MFDPPAEFEFDFDNAWDAAATRADLIGLITGGHRASPFPLRPWGAPHLLA